MDLAVREEVMQVLVVRPWHEVIIATRDDLGRRGDRREKVADLKPLDDAYLREARDHLSFWPRWMSAKRRGRKKSRPIRSGSAGSLTVEREPVGSASFTECA